MSFKIFIDLFDVVCTLVAYITYNMGNRDLPDIYSLSLGPAALGLRYIYQANPSCPCYNLSLSTIVLNSRDRQGMYGMQHFHASRNSPYNRL